MMNSGEPAILDQSERLPDSNAAASSRSASTSTSASLQRGAGRFTRRIVLRVSQLVAVVVSLLTGFIFLRSLEETNPDRLWVEAENAFGAGQWNQTRAALKRLEHLRAKTPLDWML